MSIAWVDLRKQKMFSKVVRPENRTCGTCHHVFSVDTLFGLFQNHTLRCGGFKRRSMGQSTSRDTYLSIGGVSRLHRWRIRRQRSRVRNRWRPETNQTFIGRRPDGNFHDVCREMDRDPEAPVPTEVVVGGETYFQRFQQSLEVRATSSNPLDFRGSRLRQDLDNLLNIFTFVRDFRLSTLAGGT